jgi:acyl carrier protein
MDDTEINQVVCGILRTRFAVEPELLTDKARFQEDLGLDSVEVAEVLAAAQDETGIELDLSDLTSVDDVATIGALAGIIMRAAGAQEMRNSG